MVKKLAFSIGIILCSLLAALVVDSFKDNHVLVKAVKEKDLKLVKNLLDQGLNINVHDSRGYSPLVEAILQGNVEMIQLLLENGADVNSKDGNYDGIPPLFIAAGSDLNITLKLKIMKLLLNFGANINDKNKDGNPLLLCLIDTPNEDIKLFDFLLKHDIDVNLADTKTGKTSLMLASEFGKLYIVKELLKKGANVNASDKYEETALFCATMGFQVDVIKELLSHGADATKKDEFGQSILLVPIIAQRKDIVDILLKHGATIDFSSHIKENKFVFKGRNKNTNSVETVKFLLNK